MYTARKGFALKKAGSFYEVEGVHGTPKPEDFIELLDKLYLDPLRAVRAGRELHGMRMSEVQRWPDFLQLGRTN